MQTYLVEVLHDTGAFLRKWAHKRPVSIDYSRTELDRESITILRVWQRAWARAVDGGEWRGRQELLYPGLSELDFLGLDSTPCPWWSDATFLLVQEGISHRWALSSALRWGGGRSTLLAPAVYLKCLLARKKSLCQSGAFWGGILCHPSPPLSFVSQDWPAVWRGFALVLIFASPTLSELGLHRRILWPRWLPQHMFTSRSLGGWVVQGHGAGSFDVWWELMSWFMNDCLLAVS